MAIQARRDEKWTVPIRMKNPLQIVPRAAGKGFHGRQRATELACGARNVGHSGKRIQLGARIALSRMERPSLAFVNIVSRSNAGHKISPVNSGLYLFKMKVF
jgi:hypothetical protein